MLLLAPFIGGTSSWAPTYVSIIVVAFAIGQIVWLRGAIRAVQEQRAKRASRPAGYPESGDIHN
jgi:hypothetical protein